MQRCSCVSPGMERFSLDLMRAVKKKTCIGSGVSVSVEFVVAGKSFFDFVI